MASKAVRRGDINSAGGATLMGSKKVLVNGRPLCYPGIKVTPPPCCGAQGCDAHCAASTTGGSKKVMVEGKPVLRVGDIDTCGHPRRTGSSNVIIG